MNDQAKLTNEADGARERAKRITLVLLSGWVALVFVVTVLKFAKVW